MASRTSQQRQPDGSLLTLTYDEKDATLVAYTHERAAAPTLRLPTTLVLAPEATSLPPHLQARVRGHLATRSSRVTPNRNTPARATFDALVRDLIAFADSTGQAPPRVLVAAFAPHLTLSGARQLVREVARST